MRKLTVATMIVSTIFLATAVYAKICPNTICTVPNASDTIDYVVKADKGETYACYLIAKSKKDISVNIYSEGGFSFQPRALTAHYGQIASVKFEGHFDNTHTGKIKIQQTSTEDALGMIMCVAKK